METKINFAEITEIQEYLVDLQEAYENTVNRLEDVIDEVDENFAGETKNKLIDLLEEVKEEFEDREPTIEDLQDDLNDYEANVIDEENVSVVNPSNTFTIKNEDEFDRDIKRLELYWDYSRLKLINIDMPNKLAISPLLAKECSYVKNLDNFLRRKIKISKFDRCFII